MVCQITIEWNLGQSYFGEQMSSYQFVNSLTSCYGQRGDGSVPSADYYSPQAYNSCYGAANVAAAQAGPGPASPVTASYPGPGYLQQNGADHHPHHATHHGLNSTAYSAAAAAAAVCSGQNNRLSHHQPPTSIPTRTPTPSSCKYGTVEAAASPQDLSTSSTGAGQSSDGSRASPNQPQSGRGASSSSTTANPSNSESNNNSSSKGSSGQPQIYPWMRKVHVGQNKFGKSKLLILL